MNETGKLQRPAHQALNLLRAGLFRGLKRAIKHQLSTNTLCATAETMHSISPVRFSRCNWIPKTRFLLTCVLRYPYRCEDWKRMATELVESTLCSAIPLPGASSSRAVPEKLIRDSLNYRNSLNGRHTFAIH